MYNSTKSIRKQSELIEALQEQQNQSIFLKWLQDTALHKHYGIKHNKRLSVS